MPSIMVPVVDHPVQLGSSFQKWKEQEKLNELVECFQRIFSVLNNEDKNLLVDRFFHGQTLQEIANKRNCHRERIRQKIDNAIVTIRKNIRLLEPYNLYRPISDPYLLMRSWQQRQFKRGYI